VSVYSLINWFNCTLQQELQDRIEKLKSNSRQNATVFSQTEYNEEMIKLRKDIVNFHGEMVLLENYSALNYTGMIINIHTQFASSIISLHCPSMSIFSWMLASTSNFQNPNYYYRDCRASEDFEEI